MGYTMNDSDSRYNGWTNYATWRVNLEMFDDADTAEYFDVANVSDASTLAATLKEHAESVMTDFGDNEGLAIDYALAFLSDVNWYEIAEHMLDEIRADA